MKTCDRIVAFAILLTALVMPSVTLASDEYDTKPQPQRTPPPEYPADLRRNRVEGVVVLLLNIDTKGVVTEAAVVNSTEKKLEKPAVAGAKRWRFKPATKNGEPVASSISVPLHFTLDEAS